MDQNAYSAGWIALIHKLHDGRWADPSEAAEIVGVTAQVLRGWAEQGVISRIRRPGAQYRYLCEELEVVVSLAGGGAPSLRALKRYISDQLREIARTSAE
jgi:hypothetical protein